MSDDVDLPAPPWNVKPYVAGEENGDPPRLVKVLFYDYSAGVYKNNVVWATGSLVDDYLAGGQMVEWLNVNTKMPPEPKSMIDPDDYDDVSDEDSEPDEKPRPARRSTKKSSANA